MFILTGAAFLALPAMISISSVGKEYFTESKSNVIKYSRVRFISILDALGIVNEAQSLINFLKSESNNENTNRITTFDSTLSLEDAERRRKIQKNQQHNDILELNLGNLPSNTSHPETTKLYVADNSKFYSTIKERKSSLGSEIELDRIIDSKTFNVMPFPGEVPVQASPLFSDDILYFVTRENSVAGWNFKTDDLIFRTSRPTRYGSLGKG